MSRGDGYVPLWPAAALAAAAGVLLALGSALARLGDDAIVEVDA